MNFVHPLLFNIDFKMVHQWFPETYLPSSYVVSMDSVKYSICPLTDLKSSSAHDAIALHQMTVVMEFVFTAIVTGLPVLTIGWMNGNENVHSLR